MCLDVIYVCGFMCVFIRVCVCAHMHMYMFQARDVCGGATGRNGGHIWRVPREGSPLNGKSGVSDRGEFEHRSTQALEHFIRTNQV